ncbi:lantipeptide synthetase [Cutibacterium sp. WCA-380-WT-3A]|uniref:Lantipeptide synthetase n=1 Tax=Cutibacterium porci TaxID=2605781 RepID=A0A7K0J3W1_9ACTN|nr:lantipeptide synthetase [Cutibacterium porci]
MYRALWQDDRPVVIKEARHLCGLDADGIDAPARLRHEFQVLQRLAPHRVAPQPIDLLETPEGTFLVMGFLEGMTLYQEMARFHPLSGHGSSRMSHAEFSRWRQDTMESLKDLIQILSECGIVHGDLHPANLIHVGNDLFATDFESSSIDGVSVSTGLTALPFRSDKDACDLEAVAHIHALLLDPTSGPVLTRRPELRSFVTRAALEDITMTAPPAPDMMPHLEHLCTELADGIRASATPSRTDRLFPSDPYLFQHPGAELGLMHGAAGVLAALSATGHEIDPDHVSWLTNRLSSQPILLPGLADGVEGIALGLSMCGEGDLSAQLLDRTGVLDSSSQTPIDPSLGTGLAGRAAALQTLSRRLSSDRLAQAASTLWERLATVIRDADGPLPNGLFTGWEGVGLAVLSSPLPDRHHLANIALELALSTTVTIDGALISEAGGVQWPYLGQGPIACGPLAEALGDAGTVASVARTCRSPLTESSGLLLGRSGLLVVLRQLIGDDNAAVQRHMMRLAWSITGDGTTSHMLGLHGLRFSSDVATGSAGALLTLSDHPWKNIAKILGILGDRCHEDLMTIGSVATPWAPED